MNTQLETLSLALENLLNGEPAPRFLSPEFVALADAIKQLTADQYHALGARTLQLLLSRLLAGMHAERAVRIMRSTGDPTH